MSVLASINLDDIVVELVKPFNGLAITGKIETREVGDGTYTQITLPIFFQGTMNDPKNGVDESTDIDTLKQLAESVTDIDSAKAAGLQFFTARWNVKPEWFTGEFSQQLREGSVEGKEKTSYQMNFAGVTKSLFKALGLNSTDFSAVPEGAVIGFKASASKKEPDRRQIRLFFQPRAAK